MTREEAILLLHDMKDTYDEIHENTNYEIGYEQMTALDMAIEALSEGNIARDIATILENEQDMRVILKNAERPEGDLISRADYCADGERREPHGFTADEWYRNTFKDGDAE